MNHLSDTELRSLLRESFPEPESDPAFARRVLQSLPSRKSLLVCVLEFIASPYFLWMVTVALCVVFRNWITECARICVRSIQTMSLPEGDSLSLTVFSLSLFAVMFITLLREAEDF